MYSTYSGRTVSTALARGDSELQWSAVKLLGLQLGLNYCTVRVDNVMSDAAIDEQMHSICTVQSISISTVQFSTAEYSSHYSVIRCNIGLRAVLSFRPYLLLMGAFMGIGLGLQVPSVRPSRFVLPCPLSCSALF